MTRNILRTTTVAIVLAAGTATAAAQTETRNQRNQPRDNQPTRQVQPDQTRQDRTARTGMRAQRTDYASLVFKHTDDLMGADVKNADDTVGSIEDFVVDRGSGQIRFAIVNSGAVLGVGGDEAAVPYRQLTWSEQDNAFVTRLTQERLEAMAERLPDDWNDLRNGDWMDASDDWNADDAEMDGVGDRGADDDDMIEAQELANRETKQRAGGEGREMNRETTVVVNEENPDRVLENQDADRRLQPGERTTDRANANRRSQDRFNAERLAAAPKAVVKGTVVGFKRDNQLAGQEFVIIGVETPEGIREVNLGPSWYLSGQDNVPYRGTQIEVEGVEHDGQIVAFVTRTDGAEARWRNDQGQPEWATDARRAGAENIRQRQQPRDGLTAIASSRYILLSELIEANAEARGVSSGEIKAAVVEVTSGKVAFLGFDANENFLGIGDAVTLVPFSAATIGRDMTVNIDADENDLGRAMEIPDDLSTLNTEATLMPVYQNFGVEPARFESNQMRPGARSVDPAGGAVRDADRNRTDRAQRDRTDRTDRTERADRTDRTDRADRTGRDNADRQGRAQRGPADDKVWGADSDLTRAVAQGREDVVIGTVLYTATKPIQDDAADASVVVLQLQNGQTREIVLCPVWHAEQAGMNLKAGDRVRVQTRTGRYMGAEHAFATTVEKDGETKRLWEENSPAWAR